IAVSGTVSPSDGIEDSVSPWELRCSVVWWSRRNSLFRKKPHSERRRFFRSISSSTVDAPSPVTYAGIFTIKLSSTPSTTVARISYPRNTSWTSTRGSRPASFCNLTHSRNISEKSSLRTPTKTPLPRVSEWALTTTSSRSAYASPRRSEEHTSELQSRFDLVCRLLLEKKNNKQTRRLV